MALVALVTLVTLVTRDRQTKQRSSAEPGRHPRSAPSCSSRRSSPTSRWIRTAFRPTKGVPPACCPRHASRWGPCRCASSRTLAWCVSCRLSLCCCLLYGFNSLVAHVFNARKTVGMLLHASITFYLYSLFYPTGATSVLPCRGLIPLVVDKRVRNGSSVVEKWCGNLFLNVPCRRSPDAAWQVSYIYTKAFSMAVELQSFFSLNCACCAVFRFLPACTW